VRPEKRGLCRLPKAIPGNRDGFLGKMHLFSRLFRKGLLAECYSAPGDRGLDLIEARLYRAVKRVRESRGRKVSHPVTVAPAGSNRRRLGLVTDRVEASGVKGSEREPASTQVET
jgi:hypothetical protein